MSIDQTKKVEPFIYVSISKCEGWTSLLCKNIDVLNCSTGYIQKRIQSNMSNFVTLFLA